MNGETVSRKNSGPETSRPEGPGLEGTAREARSRWLAAGALLSLGLALSGALQPSSKGAPDRALTREPEPPQAVARVGEIFLTQTDLRRAVESQIGLRRDTMSAQELKELLDDLVEEELLMQRAQTLGLLDTDPSLRRALVISMKDHVPARLSEPSVEQIESFYERYRDQYEGRALDEIRPRVLRDLDRLHRQEALDRFVISLRSKAKIEHFLGEPPIQTDGSEAGSLGETEPES